jgi:hypothetical protein
MRSLDALSWPLRRWLADRLVGQHAYSRHVASPQWRVNWPAVMRNYGSAEQRHVLQSLTLIDCPPKLYDQDRESQLAEYERIRIDAMRSEQPRRWRRKAS